MNKIYLYLLLLIVAATAVSANGGAIWTTRLDCGQEQQDVNQFPIGASVYIRGEGFDPDTSYPWAITGQPGGASCDPSTVVTSGNYATDSNGDFCFEAYYVHNDDCGTYTVDYDGKNDNYRVTDGEYAACGDGILDFYEECDDGNTDDGDGCSATCTVEEEPECGDGVVEGNEVCDMGFANGVPCVPDYGGSCQYCTAQCDYATINGPYCGDGAFDPANEGCDDGNNDDGDGCSANCEVEYTPECGNGILDAGEACDDGNTDDGDGCSATCETEVTPYCGDGILNPGEQCDDGNNADGDGCSANCAIEASCGDGTVDPGEACDDGNNDDGDGCSATCEVEIIPYCGDGFVDAGEACDDGNNDDDDGCSAICEIEHDDEIPEFGIIGAGLVLALAGLYINKRR